MSDNKKNRRKELEDFLKYSANNMSGREKNAFERELQYEPFEEEALEGLSSVDPKAVMEDMGELRIRLHDRLTVKKARSMVYLRLAASVAVFVVVTSVFYTFFLSKTNKLPSETAITGTGKKSQTAVPVPEIHTGTKVESESLQMPDLIKESPADTYPVQKETRTKTLSDHTPQVNTEYRITQPSAVSLSVQKDSQGTEINDVHPVIEGSEAAFPSERDKSYKGTSIEKDYLLKEDLMDHRVAMPVEDITSVPGNGVRKKQEIEGSLSVMELQEQSKYPDHKYPYPANGWGDFNNYIKASINFPEGSELSMAAVVISFKIGLDGKPDNIHVISSPDEAFSKEAIRLLKNGPDWNPAETEGKMTEEDLKLRIIFKR